MRTGHDMKRFNMAVKGRSGIRRALPFLLPSLVGGLLFSLLPIIISLFLSLTDWTGMTPISLNPVSFLPFIAGNFVGLDNFSAILTTSEFWTVLSHNLYFIVLYLPLMLIFSMTCALIIGSRRHGSQVYRVLYYIPVLTSWVAGALIWKWLLSPVLSPVYGPVNNFLAIFGIEGPMWLQSEVWAMPSIVLASVWKDMGFYGMILLGGLKAINPEYYEAAGIDGAGRCQIFFRITLPLLSSVIFYVVMLSRFGKMGYAAAFSWLLFIVIMIFTLFQKLGERRFVSYDN